MTDRLDRLMLPGMPRRLLAVLVAAAVVACAWSLTAHTLPALGRGPVATCLSASLALTLQVLVLAILHRRTRLTASERTVWRAFRFSAALVCAGMDVSWVLALVPVTGGLASLPLLLSLSAAFAPVYASLLGWNRHATPASNRQEYLNGTSAVLAATALVAVGPTHRLWDHPQWWFMLAVSLHLAAGMVLAGTAFSLTCAAGRRSDRRIALVGVVIVAVVVGDFPAALGAVNPATVFAWSTAAVVLGLAGCLAPRAVPPIPADLRVNSFSACGLILLALAELVVASLRGDAPVVVVSATAAAAVAGLNLLVLVNTQFDLAVSREEALTDDLTGVGNRRAVLRRLDELSGAGLHCALVMLDVDKFKDVNEGLGHSGGDDLLRLIAQRLNAALIGDELIGRLAGDEFAVVAPVPSGSTSTPDGAAAWLGARMITALAEPFTVAGMKLHLSVSAGAASTMPGEARTDQISQQREAALWRSSDLLRWSDAAMHEVKNSGRGLALYDPQRHADASGNLALVEDLRLAMTTGQILLHHQPQVETSSGDVVGVEALVRWMHPHRGLLFPNTFIPLAELHGLIGDLTEVVLEQAVAQAATWRQAGIHLRMSVNLSAANLLDADLPSRIAALLLHHGVPATAMVFEVTESMLMSDPVRSAEILAELSALGSHVSIDDFGTGYASLSYLRSLPVSELKLDRSFTTDLLSDRRAAAIVASTVNLAHELGLRVVGEGVEDDATLAHLAAIGCDETQGYLHAKPMAAGSVPRWLAEWNAARQRI